MERKTSEKRKRKKKRVEEISQDKRKKIREEERRKIIKEMKREKHASYSSHNSCKSLSEELRDCWTSGLNNLRQGSELSLTSPTNKLLTPF